MAMALLAASRSTCARRAVGCVLVDRGRRVMSTGYNGPPSGFPHCTAQPCAGAGLPSGSGLDLCQAVHAEVNAVARCTNINAIEAAYCTTRPCSSCTKLLVNTSCRTVYYLHDYPDPSGIVDAVARPRFVKLNVGNAADLLLNTGALACATDAPPRRQSG